VTVELDAPPEPGSVEICGPRLAREVALGYVLPVGTALGVVAGMVLGLVTRNGNLAVTVFILVVVVSFLPYTAASLRRRRGRDFGAGLPLAELGPTGARLRYEAPFLRDRRAGQYRRPRYDVAVAWPDVAGWRRAIDPFGAPVLVLELAEPRRVAVRDRFTLVIQVYVDALGRGLRSPAVVRIPTDDAEHAAVEFLRARGLSESPTEPPPAGWPLSGGALMRRGRAMSNNRHR
jgi:hypothetical protein